RMSWSAAVSCAIVQAHAQRPRPAGRQAPARSAAAPPREPVRPGLRCRDAGRRRARRMTVPGLFGFLGRQARWALPAGVFIGIALPGLAAMLRPLLTVAVIGTLTAALLRLDWARLAGAAKRPALPAAIATWQLVLSP